MTSEKRQQTRRPQDWSAAEKLAAVLEAASLSEEDVGRFLRRQGLHRTHLEQWRQQMLRGLDEKPPPRRRPAKSAERRHVRELEKDLRRKNAALAETAALLVLKKKAQAIWGDGDDDTVPRSGK